MKHKNCGIRKTQGVVIRRFEPRDAKSCRALWAELTAWHRGIYDDPTIGGKNPGRFFDSHLRKVGRKRIWVAESGGKVVGIAGMRIEGQEAELEPLVVQEERRGSGIGQKLTEAVIEAARRAGVQSLTVSPVARNERAIQFFHGMGFDILGHVDMFMELTPSRPHRWSSGKRIADRDFRY